MPLKTLVKVGSLTNLSEARYCAGMDVQLLGFQTVPALDNYISPARYQEIRGWITGPLIVAEVYGAGSREVVDGIVEAYRPDYLELAASDLPHVSHITLPIILRVGKHEIPNTIINPAYFLMDKFVIYDLLTPVIIQVSSASEAAEVIKDGRASGIALSGSDEISPGLKTYDTIAPILEMLEDED